MPSDKNGACAKGKGFEDIGPTPEAAIDKHGNAACNTLDNLGQALDSSAAALFGASAVVRNDDAVDAISNLRLCRLNR